MFDGEAFAKQVVQQVKDFVARSSAALSARIDTLDETVKAIPAGPEGKAGADGAVGPQGPDGAPGRDGQDADPQLVESLVAGQFKSMADEFVAGLS